MFEYIWILLPIGLLIGWLAAKKDNAKRARFLSHLNLRYLIDQHEEKELTDIYDMMPIESDVEALKFSLILGDAFRRKGEIDHAINLHNYVIEQAESEDFIYSAHYSLAQDYLAAGFLDRAESTLRFLLGSEHYKKIAQLKLAKIFEQQREWLQAISLLERVEEPSRSVMSEIAHLYCELAEESLLSNTDDITTLTLWLDKANEADSNCIRAIMIRGRVFIAYHRYEDALLLLKEIERLQSPLIVLVIPVIYRLYTLLNREDQFGIWLENLIHQEGSHLYLKIWRAHHLLMDESLERSIQYLKEMIKETPNLQGMLLLKQLLISQSNNDEEHQNEALYLSVLDEIIDRYAHFQCEKCGFATRVLQWQCPSCAEWNTSVPVSDIIALKQRH